MEAQDTGRPAPFIEDHARSGRQFLRTLMTPRDQIADDESDEEKASKIEEAGGNDKTADAEASQEEIDSGAMGIKRTRRVVQAWTNEQNEAFFRDVIAFGRR